MPTSNVRAVIDALATGKVADANKAFTDEMEDLVSSRLADKRIEVANQFNGPQVVDLDDPNVEQPELPDPTEVVDASQEAGEMEVPDAPEGAL